MVYDLTEPSSLEDIQNFWIPEAYNYVDKNIDVMLLGNKKFWISSREDGSVRSYTIIIPSAPL